MTVFQAAERYRAEGRPVIVVAGRNYGCGSSRDWAAKGTRLLGVRAVIAESFERIHRSNLVGMGVLPLQFPPGMSRHSLALTGDETFDIPDISARADARRECARPLHRADGPSADDRADLARRHKARSRMGAQRRRPALCAQRIGGGMSDRTPA